MDDGVTTDHDDLAGMLPDYAVGALDDDDSRRVARHLDECPPCRIQLEQLWEVAAVFAAAPPSPAVRDSLLARLTVQETSPGDAADATGGAPTGSARGVPPGRAS